MEDRYTDRQTDRDTDRQTDRETDQPTDGGDLVPFEPGDRLSFSMLARGGGAGGEWGRGGCDC